MRSAPRLRTLWLLAGAATLAAGCILVHPAPQPAARPLPADAHDARNAKDGPPPWAPAHGYRRKQGDGPDPADATGDLRVVFDSERGVHVVRGLSDHYWDAGRYYRVKRGEWQVAAHAEGPWVRVELRDVPLALVRAATSKNVYPARRAD